MIRPNIDALDLGFGYTKGESTRGKRLICPSVVGTKRSLFEVRNEYFRVELEVDKEWTEFFIGDLAIMQSEIKYFSMADNKLDQFATNILLKATLGYMADFNSEHVCNLVTGLPVDFYFKQKADMENTLGKIQNVKVRIKIGRDEYDTRITINQFAIIPQPIGSMYYNVLDSQGNFVNSQLAGKTVLIIDIGTGTVDFLALNAMEIIQPLSTTVKYGLSLAYKTIAQEYNIPIYLVEKRIRSDRATINPVEVYKQVATAINEEIASLNYDFDFYIITGGGGAALYEWILPGIARKMLSANPQIANCLGYKYLGKRLWKDAKIL